MPVAKTTDDADEPAPLNAKASAPSTSGKAEFPDQTRVATAPAQPIRDPAPVRDVPAEEDLIRTAEQFQNVWRRIAAIGGVMRLAAGAELELPTMVVNGPGRYEIEAEPSADDRRPKLRLRPSPAANPASADGDFLFDLRSGTLSIAGVDLVIPDTEPLRGSRLAAIGLRPGTSVALSQSTVSVLADRARAERPGVSLFVLPIVNRAELATATEKTGSRAASIRVRNSFLRSAGDGVFIAQGRLLDLQLTDVLVGTDGSLIHAFGAPRVAGPEPVPQNIRIERVTARLRGGLVHLESSPEDRELPPTKIVADHSIFSMADRDEPLFRLTWRDEPGKLRNTILPYEGKNVVYHHVNVYRLDETAQTGVSPKPYTRSDWTNAFLPKDAAPVLEVKFLNDVRRPIAAGQLTRDDLRLAAGAQVLDVGCPPDRVPEPPPVTDRSL
jgi:serine/threonine-protein kinase